MTRQVDHRVKLYGGPQKMDLITWRINQQDVCISDMHHYANDP